MKHTEPFPDFIPLSRIAKYVGITEATLKKGHRGIPVRNIAHGKWGVFKDEWQEYLDGTRVVRSSGNDDGSGWLKDPA